MKGSHMVFNKSCYNNKAIVALKQSLTSKYKYLPALFIRLQTKKSINVKRKMTMIKKTTGTISATNGIEFERLVADESASSLTTIISNVIKVCWNTEDDTIKL